MMKRSIDARESTTAGSDSRPHLEREIAQATCRPQKRPRPCHRLRIGAGHHRPGELTSSPIYSPRHPGSQVGRSHTIYILTDSTALVDVWWKG